MMMSTPLDQLPPHQGQAGIYVHIPFCRQACHYCNFHFSTNLLHREDMIRALVKEIDIIRGKTRRLVPTVYFGGGTPSILTAKELRAIMDIIRQQFQLMPDAEFTIEVNPDDINAEMLALWKEQGFTRLSMGVQSFRDQDLQWMNRSHSASQALEGIKLAQQFGFDNLTIDLIYGVPGLSDADWIANLHTAIELGVPHISAYALTVEPKTALPALIEQGKKEAVNPEQQSRQFLITMNMLEQAGFEHYEISNFAKPGYRSRHNSAYWKGIPYFGFGPGSHSYDGYTRYWNVSNNHLYIDYLISNGIIPFEKEDLTETMRLNEYIMTSIRTMEGIDLQFVSRTWGQDKTDALLRNSAAYASRGMLTYRDGGIVLTREGKLFADGVAADLFFLEEKIGVNVG